MSITKEQFEEWKTHPVTVEVFKEINRVKEDLKEALGNGSLISQLSAETTHGATNRLVGQIAGLNQLLNLEYEDED